MWTAQRNSKTGRKTVHALTDELALSNYWNLLDNNEIKMAGTKDFASKIVAETKGGAHRLFLKQAIVGFWTGTTKASRYE